MSIRLVLDTSAIVAYTHGSDGVGETIREVVDEGNGYALPVLCLAEAATTLDDKHLPLLDLLVCHSHAVELHLPQDWRDLATAARMVGGLGRAAAMLGAAQHRAYVLTADPGGYGDDADGVIGV